MYLCIRHLRSAPCDWVGDQSISLQKTWYVRLFILFLFSIYMNSEVLQAGFLHPFSRLIKPDLLPINQTFLQCTPNLHSLHRSRQLHRHLPIIQTRSSKLVRLSHERLLEPSVIRSGYFSPNPRRLIDVNKIALRLHIDSQFPLCTDNLSSVLLPRSHHARAIQIRNPSAIELDDPNRIIPVIGLQQRRLDGRNPTRNNRLDSRVLPEEPQRKIDIMDRAINKDPGRELRVGDKEPTRIKLIARLTPENRRPPNKARIHLLPRVTVGSVEAAGETAHDLQMRLLFCSVDNPLRLYTKSTLSPSRRKPPLLPKQTRHKKA